MYKHIIILGTCYAITGDENVYFWKCNYIYIYIFFFLPKKIDLEGQTEIYFINKLLVPNCG